MAEKRTAACRYPSKYDPDRWVTASQHLAEVLCERRARAEGRTLPFWFWTKPYWADVYRRQVVAANRLIKRLDPDNTGTGAAAILAFLRSEQGKTCYSLMGAWVVPLVQAAHKAILSKLEGL